MRRYFRVPRITDSEAVSLHLEDVSALATIPPAIPNALFRLRFEFGGSKVLYIMVLLWGKWN